MWSRKSKWSRIRGSKCIKVYQCVSKKNFLKKGYQGDQVIKGSMCIKGSTKIWGDQGVSRKWSEKKLWVINVYHGNKSKKNFTWSRCIKQINRKKTLGDQGVPRLKSSHGCAVFWTKIEPWRQRTGFIRVEEAAASAKTKWNPCTPAHQTVTEQKWIFLGGHPPTMSATKYQHQQYQPPRDPFRTYKLLPKER